MEVSGITQYLGLYQKPLWRGDPLGFSIERDRRGARTARVFKRFEVIASGRTTKSLGNSVPVHMESAHMESAAKGSLVKWTGTPQIGDLRKNMIQSPFDARP